MTEQKELTKLREKIPFMWKVQTANERHCQCVAYIDSRDVQDLLDRVCGPENWQCDYKEVKGNLYCGIGIYIGNQWIWKWDCGTESNTEKEKGEASDSFKRAAVKWGVGRFLYEMEIVKVPSVVNNKGKYMPADNNGKAIWDNGELSAQINAGLRAGYSAPRVTREPVKETPQTTVRPYLNKGTDEYKVALKLAQSGDKDRFKKHCDNYRMSRAIEAELNAILINQNVSA